MNQAPSPGTDVATRIWSAMRAFVTANDRNRELQQALGLGRGTGRVKVLLLLTSGPATLRDIADANGIDAPYTTVIVDKLESLGLVERTAHPDDLRRKLVQITEAGQAAAEHAQRIFFTPPAELAALAPADLNLLEEVLTRLVEPLAPTPKPAVIDGRRRAPKGASRQRHAYGSDPSQFGDLHLPAGQRRPGTVVLIHGGWWGPKYGADNLDGAAADLAERGWVVWNIEYRRLGLGGGYPVTLQDAAAAIDYLATLEDVDIERVVSIGHSAGGQLALWAAGRSNLAAGAPGAGPVVEVAGVISLAGVLDLTAAAREKVGNGAAIDLLGGGPDEHPERYAAADPLSQVPIPAIVRCVHARADDRVPFSESVTYVKAARSAGQDAQLLEVDGGHFSIADTTSPTWPTIVNTLEELMGVN